MVGGVVSRYCNICNRIIALREIETGRAIIYGTHCYCEKCKQEVMPIIEAIKKRFEEEKKAEEVQVVVEAVEGIEEVKPVEKRVSRYKTPLPFKLQHRPGRARTKDVAKTEIFLKKPPLAARKGGEVATAKAVEVPVAKPIEMPVAKPVETSSPPAAEVTEDGMVIEPVSFDSPLDEVREEKPKTVKGGEGVKAHSEKVAHHPKVSQHPLPHKTDLPLPDEKIVAAHSEPKPVNKSVYVILVLTLLAIAGALIYYYSYYIPRCLEEEERRRKAEEEKKREWIKLEQKIIEDLTSKVFAISSLSDYEKVKREIEEVESGQKITTVDSKTKLEEMKGRLSEWMRNEAERAFNEVESRYRLHLAAPTAKLSEILDILKSYPEPFLREPLAKKWVERLKGEMVKVEATERILKEFERIRPSLAKLEDEKSYKKALELLDGLHYEKEKVLERFLKPLLAEKLRFEQLLERQDRAEVERRERARRAYEGLLKEVEEAVKENRFDRAKEMLKGFVEMYPETGADREALAKLDEVCRKERQWVLFNIFDGSSLSNLRVTGKGKPKLEEKVLKVETEEGECSIFFGYEDMGNVEVQLEFVLLEGSFKILLFVRDDREEGAVGQEIKHPLVKLKEKMSVSIKTSSGGGVLTFLHNNMRLSVKGVGRDKGAMGLFIPKGARLHILRISAAEK
ncbi:MAG: hypothetical protein N2234_09935 [Planctomycetota bacterium]|nr:hypothetical protein [Planctomycetota bacterium]